MDYAQAKVSQKRFSFIIHCCSWTNDKESLLGFTDNQTEFPKEDWELSGFL